MSGELLLINPRKRKTKTKRTAPKRRRRVAAKRRAPVVVMSNPAPRRRRSRLSAVRTKVKRASRKYRRNPAPRLSINAITGMAKNAAIGAAGALAVDVAFGYAKGMLPASMQSPLGADGSVNPLYFAAKGGLAVLVGVLGSKVTKHAADMAAGSLTVSAYEVMRSFVPVSVNLGGYSSPARIAGPRRAVPRLNQYVSGASAGGYKPPVSAGMGEYVS
jgi:hypothetical protein